MGVLDKGPAVQRCSPSRDLALIEDFQDYTHQLWLKQPILVLKLYQDGFCNRLRDYLF